jgi:DNA-binding CsgD family transcriptional regulator
MDQLRQSDQKRLLEFVRDCYAIRDPESLESFPGKLVTALSRLIPSLHTSYAEVCPEKGEFHHVASAPEISTPEVSRLLTQHMSDHLPLVYYMQTGDKAVPRISDFASRSRFHDSALYNGFYRQYDVEDDLCIGISPGPERCTAIAWHSDRCFTDREQSVAALARPYVVQAWRNARLFSEMSSQLQVLKAGLEGAALGVISCDSEGRAQFVSALARQYLVEYFGASKNLDRQLPQELLRWVRCQYEQLNKKDVPPVLLPLAVRKGDNQLVVRLLSRAGGIVLLLKEAASERKAVARDGVSLSRRESEVLSWAAQGKTNSEIASILGIALLTAKKHMEHILQKLQVENRTAAAALALRSLSRND